MAAAYTEPSETEDRVFDNLLSVKEATLRSGRMLDNIRRAMRTGKLPHVWVKGMRLIAPDALDAWVRSGAPAGGDAA